MEKKSLSPLDIKNLHVSVEGKEILHGVSIVVQPGTVHAVMGPNGSGKSTLAYAVMGHPGYDIDTKKSVITLLGKNIVEMSPEERAKEGVFLAFQSPIAVPGVTVVNLLRTAYQEIHKSETPLDHETQNPVLARRWNVSSLSLADFMKKVKEYARILHIDDSFLQRGIHEGFSGGEKKKIEMLQALVLGPRFAIFDEIDTGLDVDALKIVAHGISLLKEQGTGVIIITHYQRILSYLDPDVVHILVKGTIAATGSHELAKEIEEEGYKKYLI